jgi:hypothetical protein
MALIVEVGSVHASIWKLRGDPDQLLRGYDAMVAEIPSANLKLHLCPRAPDGIVLVDTCPTKPEGRVNERAFP